MLWAFMPTVDARRPECAGPMKIRCRDLWRRGRGAGIVAAAAMLAVPGVMMAQATCDMGAGKGPPPFTRAQNADGSRFVWAVLGGAGFPYEYVSIAAFPRHSGFRLVAAGAARPGDVVWWANFAAIYDGRETERVVTADGQFPVATLVARYGPARFYRKVAEPDLPAPDTTGRMRATVGAPRVATFLLPGGVRVDAPCGWHLVDENESDSVVSLAFNAPNTLTDSGADRTSILIVVHRRTQGKDFRALTDTLFESLGQGTGRVIVLGDTMPDATTRFVFWRGQRGGSPYSVYDDFGRKGAVMVHVRIALPVVAAHGEWMARFSGDSERLLAGLRVQQTALFLGWAARPSLSKFRP
jgi:hypothetical protein